MQPINPFEDVKQFMEACGQTTNKENEHQALLYVELITEELRELQSAEFSVDALDAVMDTIWVLAGYAYSKGWKPACAWREVARSNMDKVDPETGTVQKRPDGKVLKPKDWKGPQLQTCV